MKFVNGMGIVRSTSILGNQVKGRQIANWLNLNYSGRRFNHLLDFDSVWLVNVCSIERGSCLRLTLAFGNIRPNLRRPKQVPIYIGTTSVRLFQKTFRELAQISS